MGPVPPRRPRIAGACRFGRRTAKRGDDGTGWSPMTAQLLAAIVALEGSERLVAFADGFRVGYAHLGDQWITYEETPQGGRNQSFHPDAYAAYAFVRARGAADQP